MADLRPSHSQYTLVGGIPYWTCQSSIGVFLQTSPLGHATILETINRFTHIMIFQRDSEYGNVLPGFVGDISWRSAVFRSQNVLCKSCMSSHTSSHHFRQIVETTEHDNQIKFSLCLNCKTRWDEYYPRSWKFPFQISLFLLFQCFHIFGNSAFSAISSFLIIPVHVIPLFLSYSFAGINKKKGKAELVEKSE